MTTAAQTETYPNQFRMAIYDFGVTADSAAITTIFPLGTSLTSAQAAAANIDVMTVNGQNDQNDQDSDFDTLLTQMNSAISSPGPGTSAAPQKYLFFVSDGVADESNSSCLYTMTNSTWGNLSPRCQEPINTALCTTIKNRGIKIAILYTDYLAVPANSWYVSHVEPYQSSIGTALQACASPGLFYDAGLDASNLGQDLAALFAAVTQSGHLTQ
jgi:hypothetical protein